MENIFGWLVGAIIGLIAALVVVSVFLAVYVTQLRDTKDKLKLTSDLLDAYRNNVETRISNITSTHGEEVARLSSTVSVLKEQLSVTEKNLIAFVEANEGKIDADIIRHHFELII